jgi:hypothetical protein
MRDNTRRKRTKKFHKLWDKIDYEYCIDKVGETLTKLGSQLTLYKNHN